MCFIGALCENNKQMHVPEMNVAQLNRAAKNSNYSNHRQPDSQTDVNNESILIIDVRK